MIASYICKDLYTWLNTKERKGVIHSIFKNSLNIIGEDNRLISVVIGDKPISPNGIKLKDNLSLEKSGNIGDIGILTKTSLKFDHLFIDYANSILWDKIINISYEKDNVENVISKLQLLGDFILQHGNRNGIFTLLHVLSEAFAFENPFYNEIKDLGKSELYIKDRFIKFMKCFESSQLDEISSNAKSIIGFGQGLTPSMDDFLCGIMISNVYLSDFLGMDMEYAYKKNSEIIKDIESRTTLVSEEMLKFAAKGEANEYIKDLMICLLGICKLENLYELSKKVVNIGESSGTDILCGIYVGSTISLGKNVR